MPPLLSDREKATDPKRGLFFKNGYADFFLAWKDGRIAGTICCAEDTAETRDRGHGECMFGFFECVEDYAVAEALFRRAEDWAREHNLRAIYGTYNLDREDSRGILVEGRDRPAPILCGHNPPYYLDFANASGWSSANPTIWRTRSTSIRTRRPSGRLARLAERVRGSGRTSSSATRI